MGAWGPAAFENDNAMDWVLNLEEAEDTSILEEAFAYVASQDEITEDCEEAMAAAEVIAALREKPLPELPPEVTHFVEKIGRKPSAKLVKLAVTVVRRIAKESDLKAQWDESESAAEWLKATQDLLKRLGP